MDAEAFNKDISKWETIANVTDYGASMFNGASGLQQRYQSTGT